MWVMVLNDGETYTEVKGCKVLFVPPSEQGNIDQYVKESVGDQGIDLTLTESVEEHFTGDIYIQDLSEIEG